MYPTNSKPTSIVTLKSLKKGKVIFKPTEYVEYVRVQGPWFHPQHRKTKINKRKPGAAVEVYTYNPSTGQVA